MENKYIRRTDDEWLSIINECRTSSCPDKFWCQEHNITLSTFYYQIRRLPKKTTVFPNQKILPPKSRKLYNSVSVGRMPSFLHRYYRCLGLGRQKLKMI